MRGVSSYSNRNKHTQSLINDEQAEPRAVGRRDEGQLDRHADGLKQHFPFLHKAAMRALEMLTLVLMNEN